MKKVVITKIKAEVILLCPKGHRILVETNEVLNHPRRIWGCAECAQEDFKNGSNPGNGKYKSYGSIGKGNYNIERYEITKKGFPRLFPFDSPPLTPTRSHRLRFTLVLLDDDGSEVSTDKAITWATAYFKKLGHPVQMVDTNVNPPIILLGPTAEEMARACFIKEDALEHKTK
ncbi:MAG: hypothetical protein ABSF48_08150 [Thermodesulfobacteriota bacterium]|jgi:hypothetical protein